MNVIFTVESYYPLKNGVQEITQSYAEFLAMDNNVVVITRKIEGSPDEEIINGVKVIRLEVFTKKSIYYGDIQSYKNLLKKISIQNDVMINVCTQTALTDTILRELDNISCKKILYLHGIAHFNFPKIPQIDVHDILSWFLNIIRWKLFYITKMKYIKKYNAIIHLHKNDASFKMCSKKCSQNYVLENFTNLEMPTIEKHDETSPYIMIANYIHDKNQELAIRAYCKSKSKRPLIFVGSTKTDYLEKLKDLKKSYNLSQIEFVVAESHDQTMDRLKNAYCLIHSSKSEKYPVVLCEAAKFGKPFIATEVGVVPYIPGGIIVKNESEFANAINELESNPTLWNTLSNQGKEYSTTNQSFEKNCMKITDIINHVVKK